MMVDGGGCDGWWMWMMVDVVDGGCGWWWMVVDSE